MTDGIQRLADYVGILPSFTDYRGQPSQTSSETRRAVLAAMGLAVSSDREADDLLDNLMGEELRQPLDSVLVHERGQVNHIPVRAPRREGAIRWRMEIRSERGRLATREGLHDSPAPLEIDTPNFGIGYYDVRLKLTTRRGETQSTQSYVVVPPRCVLPSEVTESRKAFGVFANLYTLRGATNWGVGDVGDLETLTHWVGNIGGSFVGLNPLHALLNRGGDISPYGPVTRLWRNPLYIDVARVPEFIDSPELRDRIHSPEIEATLAELRASELVQYESVWATKMLALTSLHDAFLRRREQQAASPRVAAFNEFVGKGGSALTDFATWMAIAESRHEWNWRLWPTELQEASSEAVRRFAADHEKRVEFYKWLQFELDRQIGEVARSAIESGMEIGLYQDMAVGSSATGSDTWGQRSLFRDGVTVGAPPDAYSDFGQNWGLPPIDPMALRRDRYRYFIRLVRSGFRHAGALRIDHVMGLFRLFWIPEGATGKEGAYVRYPSNDLLGILALESHRHRAIVVGEDLGVVPDEVPPAMRKWGLLSSKVLYFERQEGGKFRPQSDYPELALASANTHDMPTLAGFWAGRDIELRKSLGLVEDSNGDGGAQERDRDKRALLDRLRQDAALPLHEHPPMDEAGVPGIKRAVNEFLCGTSADLVALSLDDLGSETEAINVPGVGPDKYPVWSRKMKRTVAEIATIATDELSACATRARPR